jgi:FkbM family methyltransferase
MLIQQLKAWAIRSGCWYKFRDHQLVGGLLLLREPTRISQRFREVSLYKKLLKQFKVKLVFDIGANCGSKTIIFARYASKVISVEPDKLSAEGLRARFAHRKNIVVLENGVSDSVGEAELCCFENGSAYNTFSEKWAATISDSSVNGPLAKRIVGTITLDKLIENYGLPQYVKIDVEGYEWPVFKGLSQSIRLITFECNLPVFESETCECIRRVAAFSPSTKFNFWIEEPPQAFQLPEWIVAEDVISIIRSRKFGFMEIVCGDSAYL